MNGIIKRHPKGADRQRKGSLIALCIFGSAAFALPLLAFFYTVFRPSAMMALEKTGALFLAWPYLASVLVITFLLLFRESISAAIARVQRVKGLGGEVELQVQSPTKEQVGGEGTTGRAEQIEEQLKAQVSGHATAHGTLTSAEPQLPEQLVQIFKSLDESIPKLDTIDEARDFAGRMVAKAVFSHEKSQQWKFYYLSFFFVPATKFILRWFKDQKFANRQSFEDTWKVAVPDPVSRAITLNVLVGHGLLEDSSGVFSITSIGQAFLSFLDANNAWDKAAIAPGETPAFYPALSANEPERSSAVG